MSANTQALRRHNHELTILNTIASDLNREVNLQRALEITLANVAQLCGLRTGWIWLFGKDDQPYLAASCNLPPALFCHDERMRGSCYCLDSYRTGSLGNAMNIGIVTCSRLKNLLEGTDGLRYHASVGLTAHGRPIGVLNVASSAWNKLSADDLRLLATTGDLLSIAIERTELFAQQAAMATLEERNRIAREIHDTLAQGLAAITLKLEFADLLLEQLPNDNTNPQIHTTILEALALTKQSLEQARDSVLELREPPFEGRSLEIALKQLIPTASIQGDESQLSTTIKLGLYRIAQEAMNNAQRHASAAQIVANLDITSASVNLSIHDNGPGFDPALVAADRFGIIGMRERAHLLGGQLTITSSPGQGTLIQVVVPL